MEREYIWAAHDTAGVNELHACIDWFDREAWPIQDPHNQSVYGYTDPVGELVEQRVYAPFGQILNADKTPLAKPSGLYFDFRLRVGMHGMFAERLDASTTDPLLRHADARVVYLTPNRTYDPKTGLWWQRDPNATGLLTQGSLGGGGTGSFTTPSEFDGKAHYADGQQVWLAFGSNAAHYADPSGLFTLIGISSANDLQAEFRDQQLDVGISFAQAVYGKIATGASVHQLMVGMLAKAVANGSLIDIDDMLSLFNKALGDFNKLNGLGVNHKHHILAMFLGGDPAGGLATLPREQHNHLHRMVDDALESNGLPRMRGGNGYGRMSGKKWSKLLAQGANAEAAERALRSAYTNFDSKYGTRLLGELDKELLRQGGALGAAAKARRARGRR